MPCMDVNVLRTQERGKIGPPVLIEKPWRPKRRFSEIVSSEICSHLTKAVMLALLAGANAFVAPSTSVMSQSRIQAPAVRMSAGTDEFVPDMQRRTIMNLVLLGGAVLPVGWMGGGFVRA